MTQRIFVAGVMLAAAAALSTPSFAIDIVQLHDNTSSGVPNKTGSRFLVTGKVTSPDGVRSTTNTEVAIQDSTGGIVLFQLGGSGISFTLGDSISIEGQVSQFNGLTELVSLGNYTLHTIDNLEADPLVITIDDLNNTLFISSPDSFPEVNEGRLIRINNVTIISGTWPSTCAGANTVITIQDGTGSGLLFIDKDSEVCGSPNPSGAFDVIGILSQFDTTAPFNGGYEIVPRFISDVRPLTPGPVFLTQPTATVLDSTTAQIDWTTDVVSTSLVNYGITSALGTLEGDSTLVTGHSVVLSGLQAGRLYHFRAASTNFEGTRISGDATFVTPSSTPGAMNFFFSKSIDASLAAPDTAQGGVDLSIPIINRMNAAQHDISACIYTFNLPSIADALIAAWNRGVLVRLILEADASQTQADRLRVAGIPVIISTFGGNHGSGIHHNKFFVFDTRDVTSSVDDWIWTASVNMTTQNMQAANNGVEIQDTGLAQAYLLEFNEEWGSSTDTPDAALSRMGNTKSDNTPHNLVVNGITVELYFSPSDGTDAKIVGAIGTADHSFLLAQSVFTSNPISAALLDKHTNVPGFAVRGVFDSGQAFTTGSEYPNLIAWAPPADVWIDAEPFSLHHKYGIIDDGYLASDPQVITGSHNWSNAANTVNDENTLIFHDAAIANLFKQEFAERYHNAGGSADLIVVAVGDVRLPSGLRLSAPFPNPSRTGGRVDFALPGSVAPGQRMSLRLYDMRGRLARTLVDGPAVAGPQSIEFNGRDNRGVRLAPGVYFLRLDALGTSLNQKWIVLQ